MPVAHGLVTAEHDHPMVRASLGEQINMLGYRAGDFLHRPAHDAGWLLVQKTRALHTFNGFTFPECSAWYGQPVPDSHRGLPRARVVLPYDEPLTQARNAARAMILQAKAWQITTPEGPVWLYPSDVMSLTPSQMAQLLRHPEAQIHRLSSSQAVPTGLNRDHVFYLQSRGIRLEDAITLLLHDVKSPDYAYVGVARSLFSTLADVIGLTG